MRWQREPRPARTEAREPTPDPVRDTQDSISPLRAAGNLGIQRLLAPETSALPEPIRGHYESRLGTSLSAVRIHQGPWADLATQSLGTRAFTLGSDMVFGSGQFAPHTAAGNQLLAHELVHVVQQTTGR